MSTPTAADVCRNFELGDGARSLLQPEMKPRAFLDLLIARGLHDDAAMLMAHALPKREAIWWACACQRMVGTDKKSTSAEILTAAEEWVARPSDEQRRKAFRLAENQSFEPPAGFVGMAVFFSSGSLSLPNLPPVPPKEHLSATMVGNAVKLAAVSQGGIKAPELFPQLLALGFEIADGKKRWKE